MAMAMWRTLTFLAWMGFLAIGTLAQTQAITGTLKGMLVDRGCLSWDLTPPEALPELAPIMSKGHLKTTIGMLGAHRTGIQDDLLTDAAFFEKLYDPLDGRLLVINRILSKDPVGVQGGVFYDNTNYVILGPFIERFAGDGCFLGENS
ncbi:hypothetical protein GX51_02387 [Blastomyces parvus]|uniref:Beta-lactamase-related domain-containing protein n=1 Tax=Blastomyces parvus TaxID=2060905 RepID=A0A2B7XBA9_9EURO|nr:hypothetical protein GX51_02387 [Blastomyces parvus]